MKAYFQEQRWAKSQKLREVRGCRKLLQASNLLFSTSGTSTSKTGFSKPLIAGLVGTATRKVTIVHDLLAVNKECLAVDLGCFLKSYYTNFGISFTNSPTHCVISILYI